MEIYGSGSWNCPARHAVSPRAAHFPTGPKQMQDVWLREIAGMDRYVKGSS
ncbi:MAG: hypothetical protein WCX63_09925 [Methanoregula sp.]|jgi:hypothetical protein